MIYIIHYSPLIERKKYLSYELDKCELEYDFIDYFDRDSVPKELIDKFYGVDPILWEERTINLYPNTVPFRELRKSEICNAISHIESYKKIMESDDDYGIILEDDVIFNGNFKNDINDIISETPQDYDIIFFGSSFSMELLDRLNLSKSIKISNNIYKKIPPKTRTVDGYVITKKLAKLLYNEIKKVTLPLDFGLNYFFKKLDVNCYWYDPGVIKQGSRNGIYKSSIR